MAILKSTSIADTSGGTVLSVDGVNGRLFSVDDDLSSSIYSVNTIAGLPVLEIFADNSIKMGKYGSEAFILSSAGNAAFTGSVAINAANNALNVPNGYGSFDGSANIGNHVHIGNGFYANGSTYETGIRSGQNIVFASTSGTTPYLTITATTGDVTFKDAAGLHSTSYNSSIFTGMGWGVNYLANTKVGGSGALTGYQAVFDHLSVRGTFSVWEMLIQQIRATNGSIFVTSTGKISAKDGVVLNTWAVSSPGNLAAVISSAWVNPADGTGVTGVNEIMMPVDTDFATFAAGDIILMKKIVPSGNQSWTTKFLTGTVSTFYNPRVIYIINITCSSGFTFGDLRGAEFVRIGNTGTTRNGSLYMTSDDNNAPFLDVIDGVRSYTGGAAGTNWGDFAVIKARLGRLDGLISPTMGMLQGYGLYTQNAYLENNANIVGTLSVGDGKFYAGQVSRNMYTSSQWMTTGGAGGPWINDTGSGSSTVTDTDNPFNVPLTKHRFNVDGYRDFFQYCSWGGSYTGKVTVSYWAKYSGGSANTRDIRGFIYYNNNHVTHPNVYYPTSTWTRYSWTFDVVNLGSLTISGCLTYGNGNLDIIGFQLELGPLSPYQPTDGTVTLPCGPELCTNGGAVQFATDWTSPTNGLAAGWSTWYTCTITASIVTGNGFNGNAQRVINANAYSFFGINTAILTIGKKYTVFFKHRSSAGIIVDSAGSTGPYGGVSANTGNALSAGFNFTANTDTYLVFHASGTSEWFEIDEVVIREVIQTGFGMWSVAGGFGGTMQNPKVSADDSGLKVLLNGAYYSRIGATPVGTQGFYIGDGTNHLVQFTSDGTNTIAGWSVSNTNISKSIGNSTIGMFQDFTNGSNFQVVQASSMSGTAARITMGRAMNNSWAWNAKYGLRAVDASNNELFYLSTCGDTHKIAGWSFDNTALYTGTKATNGNYAAAGAITIGSDGHISANQFRIDTNGNAYFSGNISGASGTFSGSITGASGTFSGSITGASGILGPWTISSTGLYSGSRAAFLSANAGIWIGNDGISLGTGATSTFMVTAAGALTATSGTIGPWTLSSTSLQTGAYNTAGTMYLGSSGISIGTTFRVDSGGVLYASGATISGTVTASAVNASISISTPTITGGTISIGSANAIFKADASGIYLGNATFGSAPFRVDMNGNLTATAATISGSITASAVNASITITTPNISGGTITIGSGASVFKADSNGIYLGASTWGAAPFRVGMDGVLTATGATISGNITANAVVANLSMTTPSLTGATITGGTIQTSSTGARVVLDGTNNRITFVDSSGYAMYMYGSSSSVYINAGSGAGNFACDGGITSFGGNTYLQGGTLYLGKSGVTADLQMYYGSYKAHLQWSGYTGDAYYYLPPGGGGAAKLGTLATQYWVENGAGIITATDFVTTSDIRKKQNIHALTDALRKVNKLSGVSFEFIDDVERRERIGFIAQSVQSIVPALVNTGDDGFMAVSYGNVSALLVEAIKELTVRLERLESK